MQLEGEKNKLENLLQNNLMKNRERILGEMQEEAVMTRKEKLSSSSEDMAKVDTRLAEIKGSMKGMS